MNELVIYILVAITAVFVSAVSQVLLKKSANKTHSSALSEYLNPLVIGAYALFLCATFVMVLAYRVLPLSLGPIIESLGYIFIAVLGFVVLRENITRKKLLGMLLVIFGVFICVIF